MPSIQASVYRLGYPSGFGVNRGMRPWARLRFCGACPVACGASVIEGYAQASSFERGGLLPALSCRLRSFVQPLRACRGDALWHRCMLYVADFVCQRPACAGLSSRPCDAKKACAAPGRERPGNTEHRQTQAVVKEEKPQGVVCEVLRRALATYGGKLGWPIRLPGQAGRAHRSSVIFLLSCL